MSEPFGSQVLIVAGVAGAAGLIGGSVASFLFLYLGKNYMERMKNEIKELINHPKSIESNKEICDGCKLALEEGEIEKLKEEEPEIATEQEIEEDKKHEELEGG